jgi:hypothetical protein
MPSVPEDVSGSRHLGDCRPRAEIRLRGPAAAPAVVCVNGGQAAEVPGTWSATIEWLVDRLAPASPELHLAEVRAFQMSAG